MTHFWFNFAVALALGMLIGLERERSKGEGPARRPAGIRTFALAALLDAIGMHLGGVTSLVLIEGGAWRRWPPWRIFAIEKPIRA